MVGFWMLTKPHCRPNQTNIQHPKSNIRFLATLLKMGDPQDTQVGESLGRHTLPPATFDFLILSLRAQAEMQLGLFHFGEEAEKPAPDLDLARHSIDMMNVLLDKTKGNLSLDE